MSCLISFNECNIEQQWKSAQSLFNIGTAVFLLLALLIVIKIKNRLGVRVRAGVREQSIKIILYREIKRVNRIYSAMHTLHREQIVQTSFETAWDFIQNPANLNIITPDFLDFKIVSNIPSSIFNGLIIEYRIKIPYLGYRQWVAEIKHVREPYSFVDEQRVGPYKFWYHYHELADTGNGVKIIDSVYYQVPFSVFGEIIHILFIKRMLERIFDFRQVQFHKLFY